MIEKPLESSFYKRAWALCLVGLIFFSMLVFLPLALLGSVVISRSKLMMWGFLYVRWLLRVEVSLEGDVPKEGGCLVANHTSWLDIIVLGSLFPARFVAKSEVSTWPLIGWISRFAGVVFVQRGKRSDVRPVLEKMKRALEHGGCLVLFPEGTSSDGRSVLPFKSPLSGLSPFEIIPVSLTLTHIWGMPFSEYQRPLFAWYGEMTFLPHLYRFIQMGPTVVRVTIHPPLESTLYGRKELIKKAHALVEEGVHRQRF